MTLEKRHTARVLVTFAAQGTKWQLLHRYWADSNGWLSLKLEDLSKQDKRLNQSKKNWWLGWNGERFSSTHDRYHLEQNHPNIFGIMLRQCIKLFPPTHGDSHETKAAKPQ